MRFLLFLLCLVPVAAAQEADDRPPLSLRVNHAISYGVANLWECQGSDGLWRGNERRFPGGLTAFTCFALLKSGVPRSDADLQRAIAELGTIDIESTYGAAARLFLYSALGNGAGLKSRVEDAANFLLANQREGLWGYPRDPLDMSNTQFALLGLKAAHDLGFEVPEGALIRALDAMLDLQNKSGAFRYKDEMLASAGMTAATLAGFEILEDFGQDMSKLKSAVGRAKSARKRGETWLAEHFDPAKNTLEGDRWTGTFRYATLWAIERYCDLKETKTLSEADWYTAGAEWLLGVQNVTGSWGSQVYQTCFALLFLRRSSFSGPTDSELFSELDRRFQPRPVPNQKLKSDVPYLDRWLLAGPWPGEKGDTRLFDPPFKPDKARPKLGKKLAKKRWAPMTLEANAITDLEQLVNPRPDDPERARGWAGRNHQLFALAVDLVRDAPKDAEALEAKLWFALEDGWRIFVNGEEVSRGDQISAPLPIKEDVVVPLKLPPGETQILVLVEDVYGPAFFSCRLSDPLGRPLAGVEVKTPR